MTDVLYYLTIIAPLAVLVALLLGLWNLMRTRSASRSQKLMRWRVGLQFLAIVLIMVTVYLTTG
jgi:membrane-anchored protein YejM (alkaline phosphatase superfamily)